MLSKVEAFTLLTAIDDDALGLINQSNRTTGGTGTKPGTVPGTCTGSMPTTTTTVKSFENLNQAMALPQS